MTIEGGLSLADFLGDGAQSIFVSVWAETKQGKSFFPLSWPKPLHIINFEPEGPKEAMRSAISLELIDIEDEIYIYNPIETIMNDGDNLIRTLEDDVAIYDETVAILTDVRNTSDGGTLVIDTMSTFYQILREVAMEDIRKLRKAQGQKLYQYDFGVANKELQRLMDGMRSNPLLNIVALSHSSPIYNGGNPTGRFQNGGPARMEQWVDLTARLLHDPADDLDADDPYNWRLRFESVRRNISLRGEDLWAPSHERLMLCLDDELEDEE